MLIDKEFKGFLLVELLSITGGLLGGTMLAFATNQLELIPGLFILLPGFLEMRGSISGSLSGRLSSGLHLDVIKPSFGHQKIIISNIVASIILVIVISWVLGNLAYVFGILFFNIENYSIVFIALIAGIITNLIEIPLTIATTFWLFKHKIDPDNVMGPYTTTIGDIISILSLLLAIFWVTL